MRNFRHSPKSQGPCNNSNSRKAAVSLRRLGACVEESDPLISNFCSTRRAQCSFPMAVTTGLTRDLSVRPLHCPVLGPIQTAVADLQQPENRFGFDQAVGTILLVMDFRARIEADQVVQRSQQSLG